PGYGVTFWLPFGGSPRRNRGQREHFGALSNEIMPPGRHMSMSRSRWFQKRVQGRALQPAAGLALVGAAVIPLVLLSSAVTMIQLDATARVTVAGLAAIAALAAYLIYRVVAAMRA